MKTPDFLSKKFRFPAHVWCEKEGSITLQDLELVEHNGTHVSFWKTCRDCATAHATLKKLGRPSADPQIADRMPTTEWVFLVMSPECVIA